MPRSAETPSVVLGDLEFIILELLNTDDLYGLELLQAVRQVGTHLGERFAFRPGQLFPSLRRLEVSELVRSELRMAPDGTRRRHYILTARGRATLDSL